jgi:hypothetical protein
MGDTHLSDPRNQPSKRVAGALEALVNWILNDPAGVTLRLKCEPTGAGRNRQVPISLTR